MSQSQVLIGRLHGNTPSWRTSNEAQLQQVRLIDVLDSLRVFARTGRKRIQPDRAPTKFLDDSEQQVAVSRVKPYMIDLQPIRAALATSLVITPSAFTCA